MYQEKKKTTYLVALKAALINQIQPYLLLCETKVILCLTLKVCLLIGSGSINAKITRICIVLMHKTTTKKVW